MVAGAVPAAITTVVSPTVFSRPSRRSYSGLSLPSLRSAGRSGRTSVTVRVPMVGSTSFARGLTRIALSAPACTCT